MDMLAELTNFMINLIDSLPDVFKHILSFLTDIVDFIVYLFESGQIVLAIFIALILFKIVRNIRGAL